MQKRGQENYEFFSAVSVQPLASKDIPYLYLEVSGYTEPLTSLFSWNWAGLFEWPWNWVASIRLPGAKFCKFTKCLIKRALLWGIHSFLPNCLKICPSKRQLQDTLIEHTDSFDGFLWHLKPKDRNKERKHNMTICWNKDWIPTTPWIANHPISKSRVNWPSGDSWTSPGIPSGFKMKAWFGKEEAGICKTRLQRWPFICFPNQVNINPLFREDVAFQSKSNILLGGKIIVLQHSFCIKAAFERDWREKKRMETNKSHTHPSTIW